MTDSERADSPIHVNWIDPAELALLWSDDRGSIEWRAGWMFRLALASIFFVNGVVGIANPHEFTGLLADNVIASNFDSKVIELMVWLASLNDLALGVALLSGRNRRFVFSWMAAWLCVVAVTKLTNLLW